MGPDGVLPTVRVTADSTVVVPNLVIIIVSISCVQVLWCGEFRLPAPVNLCRGSRRADSQHHMRWTILTLLHDVDHADSPNQDALLYARQSVIMIRKLPQMVCARTLFALAQTPLFRLRLHDS